MKYVLVLSAAEFICTGKQISLRSHQSTPDMHENHTDSFCLKVKEPHQVELGVCVGAEMLLHGVLVSSCR